MKSLSLAALFLHSLVANSISYTKICTQSQFDDAVAKINNGIETHIEVQPGEYVLNTPIRAKAPLTIIGNGATITSSGVPYTPNSAIRETSTHYVYKLKSGLTLFPLFYDNNDSLLAISESVADSVRVNCVKGVIAASGGFKKGTTITISIPDNLNHLRGKDFSCAYGYLDSGWDTVNFLLERSDSSSFYCQTLNSCTTKDFQYDRRIYKRPVRFVLYNVEQKSNAIYFDKEWLYVPKKMGDVYAVNLSDDIHKVPGIIALSDIVIDGVRFCGGTKISIHSGKDERCEIKNCSFRNTLEYALHLVKTNGEGVQVAVIENCDFQCCSVYSGSVVSLNSKKNNGKACIEMRECTVSRYPSNHIGYKNAKGGIWADGDIVLQGNVVYNTCRNHLHLCKGKIIAKGNVLYNTDAFTKQKDRNLSSDWGLIYCDHKYENTREALDNTSNRILIEENLLYGAYAYGGDARGVFVDHGRGDVVCRDNIILNTQSYSIDSRSLKKNEASSARNRYERNIVTSAYRLMAGVGVEEQNKPVTNGNQLLTATPSKVSNTFTDEEDKLLIIDSACSFMDGKLFVSEALYRLMKGCRVWRYARRYVRRR